jgi:hypothetical protein
MTFSALVRVVQKDWEAEKITSGACMMLLMLMPMLLVLLVLLIVEATIDRSECRGG